MPIKTLFYVTAFAASLFNEITTAGADDWHELRFDFREDSDFADNATIATNVEKEPPLEDAYIMSMDEDGDGIKGISDNCASHPNPNQNDTDTDGVGDICDNCPSVFNPGQGDINNNGIGNACEGGGPPPNGEPNDDAGPYQ
jgi:hypothetical protein